MGLALGAAELVGALGLHALKQPPSLPPELRAQVRLAGRSTATVPDPWLGYRVAPDWQDDGHAHTNRYGLREGPIDPRPGPGVLRILLLGGSTAWSYPARSNQETLPAELERELEGRRQSSPALRGRHIEVLNGGAPGYVSWQSALLYDLHLGALGPHVVISLDGSNDVSSAIKNGEVGVPMRYELTKRSYLDERPRLLRDLWRWLAYRVQRSKLALFVRQLDAPSVEELGAPAPQAVAGADRAALLHLADAARRDGALAMGVFQPVSVLAEGKPLAPFEVAVNAHEDADMPGRSAYFRACAASVRAAFDELASARPDLWLLDATHAFDGVEEITFADPAHLMPAGQRHLARAIAARLLERLERDREAGTVGGAALGLALAAQREDGLHGGDREP